MGDLIVMTRAKPLPPLDVEAGHSADILFFTGVRYYRMAEMAEPPAAELVSAKLGAPKRRRSPEQRRAAKLAREQRLAALA